MRLITPITISLILSLFILLTVGIRKDQICISDKSQFSYESQRKTEKNGVISIKFSVNPNNDDAREFLVEDVATSFSIEPTRCSMYIRRAFNRPGYVNDILRHRDEIWRYSYDGKGKKLLTLALTDDNSKYAGYFSGSFSIDWSEEYIVLEKTYTNPDDNKLVFKELKNLEKDVFTLSHEKLIEGDPQEIYGDIGFLKWSIDEKYFWGRLSDAAQTIAFFRIDTQNWIYGVFKPPPNTMGGNDLNPDLGYITYNPASYWSGDADFTAWEREERKKQGKSSDLRIYNLFIKEDRLIESTKDDPIWFYKPEWISENELEYELPSGQKKIYNLDTGEYKLP